MSITESKPAEQDNLVDAAADATTGQQTLHMPLPPSFDTVEEQTRFAPVPPSIGYREAIQMLRANKENDSPSPQAANAKRP